MGLGHAQTGDESIADANRNSWKRGGSLVDAGTLLLYQPPHIPSKQPALSHCWTPSRAYHVARKQWLSRFGVLERKPGTLCHVRRDTGAIRSTFGGRGGI